MFLDIILLLLFAVTVLIYTLRGFVASVWGVVRSVGSFFLSFLFGKQAGLFLFEKTLSGKISHEKIVRLLSTVSGYIVVFLAAFILLTVIGFIVKKGAKTPVFADANRFLGALLGIISGIIYVWVSCWILSFIVEKNLAGDATTDIQDLVRNSRLFSFFCNISPFQYLGLAEYVDGIKAKAAESVGLLSKIKNLFQKLKNN